MEITISPNISALLHYSSQMQSWIVLILLHNLTST